MFSAMLAGTKGVVGGDDKSLTAFVEEKNWTDSMLGSGFAGAFSAAEISGGFFVLAK